MNHALAVFPQKSGNLIVADMFSSKLWRRTRVKRAHQRRSAVAGGETTDSYFSLERHVALLVFHTAHNHKTTSQRHSEVPTCVLCTRGHVWPSCAPAERTLMMVTSPSTGVNTNTCVTDTPQNCVLMLRWMYTHRTIKYSYYSLHSSPCLCYSLSYLAERQYSL